MWMGKGKKKGKRMRFYIKSKFSKNQLSTSIWDLFFIKFRDIL